MRRTLLAAVNQLYPLFFLFFILFCSSLSFAERFQFESIQSLDDMQAYLDRNFPVGTPRKDVREVFVNQGHATLGMHPVMTGVEKYIYDINLCNLYVWRWNISADYDEGEKLQRIYLNGRNDPRVVRIQEVPGQKSAIYRGQRPRPEAYKGEKSLGFIVFDIDANLKTTNDQKLAGAGPSRPDPMNMGRLVTYVDVDPWRSIFDMDPAEKIHTYTGKCD